MPYLEAGGARLEYHWFGPPATQTQTLVFLHEGLGCAEMWRDLPSRLAEESGCGALVYSRRGYGRSEALPGAFPISFMHDEARVVLPEVLRATGVRAPVLIGHSDGASIALVYAASFQTARGLALLAPHVFVEDETVASIDALRERYRTTDVRERLSRYHGENTDPTFEAWTSIWLSPGFRRWSIEEHLTAVACPVVVLQGDRDEYGTLAQVRAIESQVPATVETVILRACGHAPQRDRAEETFDILRRFAGPGLGACEHLG